MEKQNKKVLQNINVGERESCCIFAFHADLLLLCHTAWLFGSSSSSSQWRMCSGALFGNHPPSVLHFHSFMVMHALCHCCYCMLSLSFFSRGSWLFHFEVFFLLPLIFWVVSFKTHENTKWEWRRHCIWWLCTL